jgi:hypothetical protein
MIYQQPEYKRPFDDSIIRSVDAVVNSTVNRNIGDFKNYLSDDEYEEEYRTVFMKLPRRCGKTVYLNKLLEHFQKNMGLNTWLVVPKIVMKRELYFHHSRVLTLSEIVDPNRIFYQGLCGRGYSGRPDVMLYDEVHPDNEKIIHGSKFTFGLYT